ncbi:MAG TPA: DDE-type integrase/transposase/recombinase [Solirubrobacterales bacterium]|nr:DDE-type integrase/transposase/recombinase [Solirubrobacterales bacterium]
MLQGRLGFSERRACRIAGQHRSTQRHEPQVAPDDAALRKRLREISTDKKRWGYRRAHARLIEEGWEVNKKRVQRLWRDEGLRVPARKRKRARAGDNRDGKELRAERPDHIWALDFQCDETADGRQLRVLNVIDEFTREALASEAARSITAEDTVATLERLTALRGATPEHIRCDNGPELIAHTLRDWCRLNTTANPPTSSRARPGRTPTSSPSMAALATRCSMSSCSTPWPRRRSSSPTGSPLTTPNTPTRVNGGRSA